MSKPLRAIERLLTVQKQKLRLAEWKLFDLQRQQAVLLQHQEALNRLLDAETTPGTPLAILAMQTSRRADGAITQLKHTEAAAKQHMHHEHRQVKRGERLLADRQHDYNRQQEKILLDDVIQQAVTTKN